MAAERTRAARRQQRTDERWQATTLDREAPQRKVRGRHLTNADDESYMQHNNWDDVHMAPDEEAAFETLVSEQAIADSSVADACRMNAARRWDKHYDDNPRNYHDRRYLINEYPTLLAQALGRQEDDGDDIIVLETGCGVGNTLLPLLALNPRVRAIGCDLAANAVSRATQRLTREELTQRGAAFCWDIGRPLPPNSPLPRDGVDTVLAIFTLSALPPEALPLALTHLAGCLKPGGQLLLRDYARLDQKQLKFARAKNARLGSGHGCEWYMRGDGTTAIFLTVEAVTALAEAAGLKVVDLRYDRRLVVNRASGARMHRAWIVGTLVKPGTSASSRMASVRALTHSVFGDGLRWLTTTSHSRVVALAAAALLFYTVAATPAAGALQMRRIRIGKA